MQPIAEFQNQLFASHRDRVKDYSFNHVVPKENVLPLVVSTGPSNVKFLFNFSNRLNKEMVWWKDLKIAWIVEKFCLPIFTAQWSLVNSSKCVQCCSIWYRLFLWFVWLSGDILFVFGREPRTWWDKKTKNYFQRATAQRPSWKYVNRIFGGSKT